MSSSILLLCAVLLGLAVIALTVLVFRSFSNTALAELRAHMSALKENTERVERSLREEIARNREETSTNARQVRDELSTSLASFSEAFREQIGDMSVLQKDQLGICANQLAALTQMSEQKLDSIRTESGTSARTAREEMGNSLAQFGETLAARVTEVARLQKDQLGLFSEQLTALTRSTEQRLERMRETVEARLKQLQDENSQKLDQMRMTVDEKLHATLEQRLGESFKIVSERLEQVHKGLGEMQTLAAGVGDLKRVLSNVKARGTWGELQLGNLLEQVLTQDQYVRNVATKDGSGERVEYAIRLPGGERPDDKPVWLPIDAKFPQEDYQRLVEAQDQANPQLAEEAAKQLEIRIKAEARAINEKYLDPPNTTEFGIMFLPIEGLYAEVLRRPGLFDTVQREFHVVVTGPTTLLAVLNSLQMGFRTLAIQKRASDVWTLLGAVKTEFSRFGETLERTKKKLDEASNTIESAATRSRAIERKLRDVQRLPQQETAQLLGPAESHSDEVP